MDDKRFEFLKTLQWTRSVRVTERGDERVTLRRSGGVKEIRDDPGYTITELRKRFGGDEGMIDDPFGNHHPLSLKPYAHLNPDSTLLRLTFKSSKYRRDQVPS